MAWLAHGQHGIEMDMRVDQRRREQPAARLELDRALGAERPARLDRDDPISAHANVNRLGPTASSWMEPGIPNQKIQRLALPPSDDSTWLRVTNGLPKCRAAWAPSQGDSRTRSRLAGRQFWLAIASSTPATVEDRPSVYELPTGHGPKMRVYRAHAAR
jgi:hypothetical protein